MRHSCILIKNPQNFVEPGFGKYTTGEGRTLLSGISLTKASSAASASWRAFVGLLY